MGNAASCFFLFIITCLSEAGKANLNLIIMYTLNFPNGNVQTYPSLSDLQRAARELGGEAKLINTQQKIYVFVPKK